MDTLKETLESSNTPTSSAWWHREAPTAGRDGSNTITRFPSLTLIGPLFHRGDTFLDDWSGARWPSYRIPDKTNFDFGRRRLWTMYYAFSLVALERQMQRQSYRLLVFLFLCLVSYFSVHDNV